MKKPLKEQFPISTFVGETQKQLIAFIEKKQAEAREAGKKEAIEYISKNEGWEDSRDFYMDVLFDK